MYTQRRGIREYSQDASSACVCSRSNVLGLFTCNLWASSNRFHCTRTTTRDLSDIEDRSVATA